MEWQPIATAPKDATVIDLCRPGDGRLTNYYRVQLSADNIFYDPTKTGPCIIRDATHWMPIPDPPHQT